MSDNGSTSASKHVLVIEDEADLVRGLRDAMQFEGFVVTAAQSGQQGIELAKREHPHLIILDLMLPDINGYRVCEQIRAFDPEVPIIMLTARVQETDKIRGLEVGADDYVTKPFSVGELLARINAIFRRLERVTHFQPTVLRIGECELDVNKHVLTCNRKSELLSFYEVELLRLLYERAEQPVSRTEILQKIWGLDAAPTNRTVDNFIVKLRKKIEVDSKAPRHILTVYGYGYKLVP